jgi:Ser/Thr protein kinase RdoA (MazF antagonist)
MHEELSPAHLKEIAGQFAVEGEFAGGSPFGSGHINDTYQLHFHQRDSRRRYVLQRINTAIFKRPDQLMENILRITAHQRGKLEESGAAQIGRRVLQFYPARSGKNYHIDEGGGCWRLCQLVEGSHTCDIIESEDQAYLTAAAFARFQEILVDLPGSRLHETIPNFHNTASRFADFSRAVEENRAGRAAACAAEVGFALQRRDLAHSVVDLMARGRIPERVTHNDTKLNNILLDDETEEALCVIDLDTVMPGSALYDFGDMVRSASCTAAEDEADLSRVRIDLTMFAALARGYLSVAGDFLNQAEIDHLVLSGKLITFEQGIRFLGDYLNGDTYYKINYPEHNLVRAKNQFALVASIEAHEAEMTALVRSASAEAQADQGEGRLH